MLRNLYSLPFLFLFTLSLSGQLDTPDIIPSEKGEIVIQPILHATFSLSWNGKTIYFDPYGGGQLFEGLPNPDLIIITDIHGDHMNIETLNAIETENATLVVPPAVRALLPEQFQNRCVSLSNGEQTEIFELMIKAIPMYNLPVSEDSRHPKGRGNGYVLTVGGKQIYISGDTEDIPEMRALKDIDIAFICMNQPFTMTIDQAADAVLEFKPKIVYPFHFRGRDGLSDVGAFKERVESSNPSIEVRLKKWYH
ncbi:MAG TPA: MBL fold metallo-hydrolase [Saprospiraceae bacterium]|nr:MBL fold metallo-hydrolase [Saprospiraceae bacterium]